MTKKRCRAFGPTAIFLFASCDVMHPFSAAYAPYTERRFDDMLDHQAGAEPNIRHTEHQSQKAHDRQRKEPKRYVVDYEGGFHIAAAAQYADDHGRGVAMEGHGERVGKHHNGAEPCGLSCEPKERQNLGTQHGEKKHQLGPAECNAEHERGEANGTADAQHACAVADADLLADDDGGGIGKTEDTCGGELVDVAGPV